MVTSSRNREIRHFHRRAACSVQRRKRNVQKSVLHVQGCYLPKPIALVPFSLTSLLKLPNKTRSRRYVLFGRSQCTYDFGLSQVVQARTLEQPLSIHPRLGAPANGRLMEDGHFKINLLSLYCFDFPVKVLVEFALCLS